MCDVDISTVINWIDGGKLKAYKTPGGHRRINRADLIEFLKRYALPVPRGLSQVGVTVVVVAPKTAARRRLISTLAAKWPDLVIRTAASGFAAGHMIADSKPALVILTLKLTGLDALDVCRHIKADRRLNRMKILILTATKSPAVNKGIIAAGADAYIVEPFDADELADCVETLLP